MACHSRSRPGAPAALLAALLAVSGSSTAGAAGAQPVPILAYHHIGAAPRTTTKSQLWVRPALLRRQLGALDRAGYEAVTLDRVWGAWHGNGTLPAHPVVLSFDDGYASQFRSAVPLLEKLAAESHRPLARLHALCTLDGLDAVTPAHSVTHPDLTMVSSQRLNAEVAGSRQAIRYAFGVPADFFAYPYGRENARVRTAVRSAGFLGATTTERVFASPKADPFALGRVLVQAGDSPSSVLRMVRTGG